MADQTAAWHQLYNVLVPLLGTDNAETLMSHLLPSPGAELATKPELLALRAEMNDRFDRINERFDRMFLAQIGGFAALIVAIFIN
jgi:hypothetical protein